MVFSMDEVEPVREEAKSSCEQLLTHSYQVLHIIEESKSQAEWEFGNEDFSCGGALSASTKATILLQEEKTEKKFFLLMETRLNHVWGFTLLPNSALYSRLSKWKERLDYSLYRALNRF